MIHKIKNKGNLKNETNRKSKKKTIKTKLKPLVMEVLGEEVNLNLTTDVSKQCNYNVEDVFSLFLDVLDNINERTLSKYMGRFAADLKRNGWKIEGTSFYKNAKY